MSEHKIQHVIFVILAEHCTRFDCISHDFNPPIPTSFSFSFSCRHVAQPLVPAMCGHHGRQLPSWSACRLYRPSKVHGSGRHFHLLLFLPWYVGELKSLTAATAPVPAAVAVAASSAAVPQSTTANPTAPSFTHLSLPSSNLFFLLRASRLRVGVSRFQSYSRPTGSPIRYGPYNLVSPPN